MTRRDLQGEAKKLGRPWDIGKSFDHSAPIGPIRRAAECKVDADTRITLEVNGKVRQQSTIGKLIWNLGEIIEHLSAAWELQPGDLIFTGTPEGVAAVGRGDVLKAEVAGVGSPAGARSSRPPRRRASMQLYSYFRSSASYRVRIALALKKLDYDYVPVHLVKNEQLAPAFRAVAPAQLVPALVVDDRRARRRRSRSRSRSSSTSTRPSRAAAAARRCARPRARPHDRARHRLRDPSARQPARAALPASELKVSRRRQEPLVPPLGRDRSRGRRAPARRPSGDRPLLPRRHAGPGRLRPRAADLQRQAHGLPARPRADGDARLRGVHGRGGVRVDAALGLPRRDVSRPADWLAPDWRVAGVGALMTTASRRRQRAGPTRR